MGGTPSLRSNQAFRVPMRTASAGEGPEKRMVGFIESEMPADGIPGCHSPRTETSARPVSKSSSREDYAHPKDLHIGKDVALAIRSKPVTAISGLGQKHRFEMTQKATFDLRGASGERLAQYARSRLSDISESLPMPPCGASAWIPSNISVRCTE
jgi:hypothetical protein